ncbi:MAG: tRNA lysidine(34) synthetase TilS [Ruminococcus sp.]|nr:tRNA lysidine(34) synthetase TilS [Ruminococcus sp.]
MIKRIEAFIGENRLIDRGDTVIVALSGGADSVTLLHILYLLKEKYELTLHAAHLNHGIRGEEADRDEDFVRGLCGELGIPLHVRRADIPALARQNGKSLELCGRETRYAFFEKLGERYGAKIATAHNRNDNAETVLWNLVRGAGLAGLSGIPVKRGRIIRPLLCCSRDEIEAYCAENHLGFVTDSTNLEELYTRNRIRLQVMPLLRQLNDNADGNIARTSDLAREADEYFNKNSLKELNECKTDSGYSCEKLLKAEPIIRRYAVRQLMRMHGAPIDAVHTELVMQAMCDGGAVELGGGYTAVCAQGILRIITDDPEENASEPILLRDYPHKTILTVKNGTIWHDGKAIPREKVNNLFVNNLIPCDIITDDAVVRARTAGDSFSDSRRGVTKSLKKLFNELKIPREDRDGIRLVASGSTVLWIEGIGSAVRVDLGADKELLYMGKLSIDNGELTVDNCGRTPSSPDSCNAENNYEGEHHA